MADPLIFEPFRDAAFRNILSTAFKSFPKRVDEILARERWPYFKDFMAAVERSGRVLLQFEGPPRVEMEQKSGRAVLRICGIANTNAMSQLLSGAFFGLQDGDVDRRLSAAALFPEGITTWHTFSMAVLELALMGFSEMSGGKTPMDIAKPDTLLFYGLANNQSPEIMNKLRKAFGLPTPQHLIALSSAFWSGDLTMEDLDRSVGNPELLTELVNQVSSNPHKGIVFSAVE